jgi:thiol-disulfide isomerase/thioredoxin
MLTAALASPLAQSADDALRRWPAAAPTPALNLTDLDGKEWNAASLRGKIVVLNFWASWCAPCIEELPVLNDLAAGEAARGKLVVLGVNYKEAAPTIRRFAEEHKFDYPILQDKSGEHFKKWTGGVLPTTVLIDANGRPRWILVGQLDRTNNRFRQTLRNMLQQKEDRK